MLEAEQITVLVAAAWFVDFVALVPVGLHLLGKGYGYEPGRFPYPYPEAAPVWSNLFIGGVIHIILGVLISSLGADPTTGFAVILFGWVFVGIGFMAHQDYDSVGVGHMALSLGILFIIYTLYFALVYGGIYGALWALIMLTVFLILLIVAWTDYGKISERAGGGFLIAFAVEALLIGTLLILGVGLDRFSWITGL